MGGHGGAGEPQYAVSVHVFPQPRYISELMQNVSLTLQYFAKTLLDTLPEFRWGNKPKFRHPRNTHKGYLRTSVRLVPCLMAYATVAGRLTAHAK